MARRVHVNQAFYFLEKLENDHTQIVVKSFPVARILSQMLMERRHLYSSIYSEPHDGILFTIKARSPLILHPNPVYGVSRTTQFIKLKEWQT